MSSYVFLTICQDFGEAQVVKSFLVSQGFHPRVRDEQTRAVAPHFEQFLGKLVVEVPNEEFLDASHALEALELEKRANSPLQMASEDTAQEHLLYTQGLAKKSLINAILGCLFLPLLCNLYSMILGWKVLRQERPLTAISGRRLIIAILFNSLAFYIWLTFGLKYFLRGL